MIFKTMKKEDVLKALEGHENILGPAAQQHEKFFKNLACPDCGSDVMPLVNVRKPFREGSILPNFLAKCKMCGIEFDPYTGIQITMPR
jgi:rubredoxin